MNYLTRREFIRLGLASSAGLVLVACGSEETEEGETLSSPTTTSAAVAVQLEPTVDGETLSSPTVTPTTEALQLEPTPQCDDHEETPAQTAGPFYTPDTPQRTSLLEAGMSGTKLVVTGKVLTTDCRPIADAILDFWHADDTGNYDNAGYRLRGHQFTDAEGNFQLETILPGLYPGRTRHIHVKVQGPNSALLTTQLYFPNEPSNANDGIFQEALVMDVKEEAEGKTAVFNFVL